MNKLEQKIFEEFDRFESHSLYITKQEGARIAAKIALEIAEKAYYAGFSSGKVSGLLRGERADYKSLDQFKQEIL